ncbi:serine/threonine-protein kinase [Tsukamurella strandjordii]|uniref:non-specific serine/threonine protein kinase n=1 Tax=Tsukamurella strandjordii TaxID=147577 RepID=A0AA90NM52_9ACTN|nr:serine/threonine protein kinase [Tsukamurella strandjordii]MDP0400229.1 protein kinase [Tsukamurella strandjordii]
MGGTVDESGKGRVETDPPGTVIGGYVIEHVLGAGGMGAVYAARHPRLPRVDALKVLPSAFSSDPTYRARFEREADMAARLDHPNIVPVYDRGDDDGRLWMSMKLVPGRDAAALLTQYPHGLPVEQVITIVDAVAAALDYAHGMGLLHRDVKPGNIMIDTSGTSPRVMLGDFGIARQNQDHGDLTSVGMVVGTLDYASPEQLSGDAVDGRSDEYSLACTAVQLLTGVKPYGASSGTAVIRDHLMTPPPAPSRLRPGLSPAVDPVIARGMAKAPQQRYPTCRDFSQALRAAAAQSAPAGPALHEQDVPTMQAPALSRPTPPPYPAAQPGYPPQQPGYGGPYSGWPQQGPAGAPPRKRRGLLLSAIAVAVIAAVALAGIVAFSLTRDDGASPDQTAAPSASASPSLPAPDGSVTLREGFIDPCLLPASVLTSLGLSPAVDDPGQRQTNGVKFACRSDDSAAAGASVKMATFTSSGDWPNGTPVQGSDKWRRFDVPSVEKDQPGFCITAYKSTANGVLYIGLQKIPGRDCERGVVIAKAITPYLPL